MYDVTPHLACAQFELEHLSVTAGVEHGPVGQPARVVHAESVAVLGPDRAALWGECPLDLWGGEGRGAQSDGLI